MLVLPGGRDLAGSEVADRQAPGTRLHSAETIRNRPAVLTDFARVTDGQAAAF